jgi:hypothetical protein
MNVLRLICLLFLLTLGCFVPVAPSQPASAPPNVTVNFSALALIEEPMGDLYYSSGGELLPIKAPVFARSPSYKYTGPATLIFYRVETGTDGKKNPTEVARVILPAQTASVLLVIAGSSGKYVMGVVDDTSANFPVGKARLSNATSYRLSIKMNDSDKIELAPGESKVVLGKNGDLGVEVSYQRDGKWEMATSNSYDIIPDGRLSMFFLTSGNVARFLVARDVQIFTLKEKTATPAPAPAVGARANRAGGGR